VADFGQAMAGFLGYKGCGDGIGGGEVEKEN